MYEGDNIRFRVNQNGYPQYFYDETEWAEISTSLTNNGSNYKIFLSPSLNPILIRINDKFDKDYTYHYSELQDIKIFENNRWRSSRNELAIRQIFDLKNEIEGKGLFCEFKFRTEERNNYFEIIINSLERSGTEPIWGPRYDYWPYKITETYILNWNGLIFEKSKL
ncbi:hypothetical protein AGMMS49579_26700 [Spirochaetia bacterium]|nr:hypothetical protein AGMMS49579_26700 [Spirochaetia bacterium]